MGSHTIWFYLLLAALGAGVLQSISVGGLFFLKRSGERRANGFYGLLLIAMGLTLLHNILLISNVYVSYPRFQFVPIYFTLSFPPLLFYYVKLTLYPAYRFQVSDIKHFILPVGQFLFFLAIFFNLVEYKGTPGRYFYSPFYGAFEHLLYIVTFFAYLYFAYRYIRHKAREGRRSVVARQVLYLKALVKVLFFLFCIHTGFLVSDFVSYEFLGINLRAIKLFAGAGAMSFAALVFWSGTYGFQVLLWGRRVFRGPGSSQGGPGGKKMQ